MNNIKLKDYLKKFHNENVVDIILKYVDVLSFQIVEDNKEYKLVKSNMIDERYNLIEFIDYLMETIWNCTVNNYSLGIDSSEIKDDLNCLELGLFKDRLPEEAVVYVQGKNILGVIEEFKSGFYYIKPLNSSDTDNLIEVSFYSVKRIDKAHYKDILLSEEKNNIFASVECSICGKTFESNQDMVTYVKDTYSIVCPTCLKEFN